MGGCWPIGNTSVFLNVNNILGLLKPQQSAGPTFYALHTAKQGYFSFPSFIYVKSISEITYLNNDLRPPLVFPDMKDNMIFPSKI